MNDCLGYIKATEQDAIDTCKRLNPGSLFTLSPSKFADDHY